MGDKEMLWVIDPDGGLVPLTLSGVSSCFSNFRQFHWWVLGDDTTGHCIDPVAFVQSTGVERPEGYDPRGWEAQPAA